MRWSSGAAAVSGGRSPAGLAAAGATVTVADVDGQAAAATAAADRGRCDRDRARRGGPGRSGIAGRGPARPTSPITTVGVNVRKRIADLTDADYDRVLDVNLRSVFRMIQAFAPGMAAARPGERAGVRVDPGPDRRARAGLYAATKAGLIQLLRTAAAEYGPDGVRFNAVAPGVVATELTGPIRADAAWSDAYARKCALARWAEPSEMVGAAVFLASDAASYMTGSVVTVDGGWTAVDGRFDPFAAG